MKNESSSLLVETAPVVAHEERGEKAERVKGEQTSSFDLLFVRRLLSIVRVLYRPRRANVAGILATAALLGAVFAQTYVVSFTGRVIGGFYDSIARSDIGKFVRTVEISCAVLVGSALLFTFTKSCSEFLAWSWRRSLVAHVQGQYFGGLVFYRIAALDTRIDNPDQRITRDVDNFSATLSVIAQQCISAPLVIAVYTVLTAKLIAWYAPLIALGYFFLGSVVNKLISSPIVKMVFRQETLEGNFRFIHTWIRSLAEPIALSEGRAREQAFADKAFAALLSNKFKIVCWQFGLGLSANLWTYCGCVLNYVIVGLPVFVSGKTTTPAEVSALCFYCIMLVSGWSQFFNAAALFSDLAGLTSRIATFVEVCTDLKQAHDLGFVSGRSQLGGGRVLSDSDCVQFVGVTYFTPSRRCLVKDLSFTVESGTNILVTGPSGCGKGSISPLPKWHSNLSPAHFFPPLQQSSLLRVLYGLWPFFTGKICKPICNPRHMQYLPQRPYIAHHCPLAEQITYPLSPSEAPISGEVLEDLLSKLDLSHLLELEKASASPVQWENVLSLGEQQRISVLRVLFHGPRFAVLDEATSALDPGLEFRCYSLLRDAHVTFLSVSHHPTLTTFHQLELRLDGMGNWSTHSISAPK